MRSESYRILHSKTLKDVLAGEERKEFAPETLSARYVLTANLVIISKKESCLTYRSKEDNKMKCIYINRLERTMYM